MVKTSLFLVAGSAGRRAGTYSLSGMGGIYRGSPVLAALFLIPALSLAGVPPLSGFWAKLLLVSAGLSAGQGAIVAAALMVSLLTLLSMTKIWNEAFWSEPPEGADIAPEEPPGALRLAPAIVLAVVTVAMGIFAEPVIEVALRAADELLSPEGYVQAVLGRGL
ncbi:MAG: proton-conducting transporter membrane subunit [Polyangiaceae bacterium]